jgi:peptide/nickel transport system substrate-binding protein
MTSDRAQAHGHDLGLDVATRLKKAEMDRRQFLLRAAAAGLAGPALAAGLRARGVAAAAQDAGKGGLVTVSQEQQQTWIRNFNPLLSNDSVRWPTHAGIYEPLLIHNVMDGKTVPWLATAWKFSPDNLTLTFTIREGVKWSDGQPFTARDVAFTHNLLKSNDALPGGSGGVPAVLALVTKIAAPDDKTVVFTFKEPFTPGLWDIGEQMIAPEHIFKSVADPVTFTNDKPVGTGPFTEIPTFEAQYWELHRNPNYWQEGKPAIEGFRFPTYPSNDAANLATVNGEIDWAANFIPDVEATYVAKDPEHFHYWFPATGDQVMLYLNTTKAPFDDPNVRKAISMGIDRAQIVQIAMYDYTHPGDATGLSDAYEKWKDKAAVDAGAALIARDVAKATELLDAAGLKKDGDVRKTADGKPLTYEINVVSGWSDWVQSCEIMAQNFKDIGIQAAVKTYDFAAWIERVQKGQFDISIGWSAGGPTPYNFYRGQMSSLTAQPIGTVANDNWHRYVNKDADAILKEFAAISDEAKQKELANKLQMLFAENLPAIPLFPGPQWGEYNSTRFTGFPDKDNPYTVLSTYSMVERLLVMTAIKPVGGSS